MRFLVTGAAGFIGSHLCRRLVADGHEVVGLDDLCEGSLENLADVPEVRFVESDLCDVVAVRKAAAECEAIRHHAAKKSVQRSVEQPELFTDVNIRGTPHVLLAARDESATVVFASSSSIYGDQKRYPLTKDMEPRPRSPYAATKLAGEGYCRAWWGSFGKRPAEPRVRSCDSFRPVELRGWCAGSGPSGSSTVWPSPRPRR